MARSSQNRFEQAAHWHLALEQGEMGAPENERLMDWLADEENARAFAAVSRSWTLSGTAALEPKIEHWLAGARNHSGDAALQSTPSNALTSWRLWAIAASLVAAIMISAAFVLTGDRPEQFATAIAERESVTLSDGSVVELDADSRIEVAYTDTERGVTLAQGRAQFDVAKDTARPFTVFSGNQAITATGTSFTVEALALETRVVLLEGEVEVSRVEASKTEPEAEPAKVVLRPGDLFVAQEGPQESASVSETDLIDASSWQSGYLTFDAEPLTTVTSRFNRYSRDRLEIDDKAAGALLVSGTYKAEDVSALLEGLEAIHGVVITRRDDAIGLASAGSTRD